MPAPQQLRNVASGLYFGVRLRLSVTIPSVTNISMPEYCLYDNGNNLITCNTTGVFDNVDYGSYCVSDKQEDRNNICV